MPRGTQSTIKAGVLFRSSHTNASSYEGKHGLVEVELSGVMAVSTKWILWETLTLVQLTPDAGV